MSIILDPKIDISEAKKVTLAGEEFYIAPLVLRQTKVITPLLSKTFTLLNKRTKIADGFLKKHAGSLEETPLTDQQAIKLADELVFTEEEFDLSIKVIRAGLSRAYPAITEDDLYDMGIQINELIGTIAVVIIQTRMTSNKNTPMGEAKAAT